MAGRPEEEREKGLRHGELAPHVCFEEGAGGGDGGVGEGHAVGGCCVVDEDV